MQNLGPAVKPRDDKGVFCVVLLKTTPYFCFLKILLLTFLKIKNPVKCKNMWWTGIFYLCKIAGFSKIWLYEKKKVRRMSRFLRFCAFLFVLFFTGNVLAAGYTCPTVSYKKYTSCKAGYYMTYNRTYNGTPRVGNACTKCTSDYECEGGTADRVLKNIVCSAGYYLPANSTTCTICPAGSYCPGGSFDPVATTSNRGITSCPAASGSYLDTYTDMQTWVKSACSDSTSSNTSIIKAVITSWDTKKGQSTITGCSVDYTLNTPCGTLIKENVPYNTSTGKYDTYVNSAEVRRHFYNALAAGYYLKGVYTSAYCNTSTNRMLYTTAVKCPGGGVYCPGFTGSTLPLCNNTAGWEYGEPMGMYGCGTGAAYLDADTITDGTDLNAWDTSGSAKARTECFISIPLNKNGGSGSIAGTGGTYSASKDCYYNTACSLPSASALTQTGYKFSGGWATTASGTSCTNSITLTSLSNTPTYYACKNPTYSITLNKQGGVNGQATLYTTKTVGAYLDGARTQSLTTAGTNKVTMPIFLLEMYTDQSDTPFYTEERAAWGYYSSKDGGTQYVKDSGVITSAGLTAAKGYGANTTWYAQYGSFAYIVPDAPTREGYDFLGWCPMEGGNCEIGVDDVYQPGETGTYVYGSTIYTSSLTAMWAPHTTIRITHNGENDVDGVTNIYATEGVDGVYLDAAHTKKMTTTTNPITYPESPTSWTVNFTDSYTGTNITRSVPSADPLGVLDSNGTHMINSQGYITSAGISAAKAVKATSDDYDASWRIEWLLRPGVCVTVPDAPSRPGYKFMGWDTDEDGLFQPGDEYCSHDYIDRSLEAYWEPITYNIVLKSGNTTLKTISSVRYGNSTTLPALSTMSGWPTALNSNGWTFAGWATYAGTNAVGYADKASVKDLTYTDGATITLYAVWKRPVTFTSYYTTSASTATREDTQYYRNTSTTAAGVTTVVTPELISFRDTGGWIGFGWALNSATSTTATISGTDNGLAATPAVNGAAHYYGLYRRTVYVNYDGNGATGGSTATTSGTQYLNAGGTAAKALSLTLANNGFSKTNATFNKWATSSTADGAYAAGGAFVYPNVRFGVEDSQSVTLYADWNCNTGYSDVDDVCTPIESTISLNDSGAITTIYTRYGSGAYLDSARTKLMSSTANPVSVPANKTFTVSFNSNGGTTASAKTSTSQFKGYYNNDGSKQEITASGYITADGIAVAKSTLEHATPWYALYGAYSAVTLPTVSRTGYTFGGWYKESALTNKVGDAGASYTPTASVTLYAKWTANTYTISFNANGGTGGQSANVTATYDATMPGISTTKPTKAGCKFMGWYDNATYTSGKQYYDASGSFTTVWDKASGGTLYAGWSCMSVTGPSNQSKVYDGAALTCNGGISVSAPSGATVTYATQSSGSCGTYGAAPTRTAAGTTTVCYKISASGYTDKTGTFTCSVTQANGSTTIKDGSTDVTNKSGSTAYPGTKSLTITCAGGATSYIIATSGTTSVATTSFSGTSVTLTPKATGSSKITVNCPATTNYKASSATYDWTVSNGTISVSKSDKSKTYDGSALTCNGLTVNSPSGTTVEYSTDGGSTWSTTVPNRTNAGTTTVNYRVSKTNYTTVTGSFSCKVNNATMTVSASDKTLTYNGTTTSNGTAQSCANVTVSVPSSGATVKYNTDGSSTYSTTGPTLTNQGSTTVYYQVTASNYTTKTGSYKCTMNPKAMTVSAGDKTKVYDGSALTCSVSVSVPSSGATVKYGTSSGSYTLTSAPTQTNVGSQTVYYQVTGSNFTTKTGSFDCSVTKATMNASLAGNSKTYNGSALTCDGGTQTGVPSGSTITYSTTNGSGYSSTKPTRTSAGTTTVYYKITNSNYNDFTGSFSCKVNKAAGTTTIDAGASSSTAFPGTKVLNITCSEGETISSATSGTKDVATVATSGNKVTLTPVKTGSSVITVNCPATTNYNASSATHTWTVSNGTITATVTNPSKTYNGSALSCAGISNVVPSGATVSYAEKSGTTCGTYSSTVPSRTNAGTTNVCYKIEATNYTTKSGEFSCKVNQADNSLTLSATSGSMPYSSTATFTVSKNTSGGTLSVESSNENCATATISGTTVTISSKANYCTANITVTSEATTNYKTKSATYALTVNKGTITLNNRSATSAGTTAIYQTYNTNVYLDNARSKAMTTSANAITVPSRTGYTFGGYYSVSDGTGTQYINASGNITSDGLTAGKALQANGTWYAKWTANTDTKYVVNHYTKNLGATTYTLNSAENKTGTTATSVTLANLKKTITGFTYSEGFAGTATKGTTKPTSGAVTTATILADGTRVIDLYYTRNTYTITVAAGNGISKVAASGWTNTGSANMTKSYEYGASIALATVVTPTQKTGYTGVAYTKTSGSGTLSGTSFTVGAGTATITAKATAISAPTAALDPESTTKVYNYQATTLTASNTTSYDSGITVYYKFGNATSADGTYTYGDVVTTNTTSVAATSHRGTKYYKVQVYATDGTLTSSTTTSSAASVTLNNKTITFNATDNGGTLSGTSPLYVSYNNASVYTGSTNTTAGTVPTATKTGYTFNGWYTEKTGGSQIYNASGALTSTAVSGYTSGSKWVATANKTLYAQFTPCTYTVKFNSNKPSTATSTVSGTMSNQSFTYDAAQNLTANAFSLPGYTFAGWATSSTGSVAHADKKSVSNLTTTCGGTVNLYAKWTANTYTITLRDYVDGSTHSTIYEKYATGWYSNSDATTTLSAATVPTRSGYIFRGFYTSKQPDLVASGGSGTRRITATGGLPANTTFTSNTNLYAAWAKDCTKPSNGSCSVTINSDGTASYTASCNAGYTLSGATTATPSCSIITYTIKYMDGSAEITGLTPATYNVTTATFNLPTAYKATYKFASWHTDSALSSTAVTQIAKGTTGNKVYYVKWSTCPAGSVCDGDDVVTCPAGSYCAAGSSEATPCAKGSYSTGGATTCTLADKGYYVDTTGATEQIACPAGTYGSTTGLTSAACSGKCSAGRYGNATAQTAATCNGACSAGYYCPAGSTSATAYDCDTGATTASSNNYWTSGSGAGARSSCYRNVVLNKNGMSGTLSLPDSSGCKSLDTSTNTLVVYYGKACKLPTTVLSGTATGTTYTGTGTWATSANAANGFVSSITVTSEVATVTYYAGKMYTCSAGYYLKANTNGACTACDSPYYCTGISKKYYSSSIQGRSACSALDSTKTDGIYSSVNPYDAATTCRFKQEQQAVPTYCETKVSNTMKYTSNGWEANTYSVTAKSGAIISGNNTTGATCSQCAAGTYSAGGTDTTCEAISAGCYGGAGSATACPNQCSAGTYRTSTGGKTQSDCSNVTAGCYGSAGATKECPAVCATNNYSNAGASACTPCDSDYANSGDTAESHAGVASCKVTCPAGQYVATANAACSDVGTGYYRSGEETVSQGNKGTRKACNALNAFYTASDSGRDAATDCFGTTTGGNYIATSKAGQVTCAAGGYCAGGSKVYYEKTGGRTACAAGTANPNTGSSASSACVTCAAGKYNTTEGNTSCSTCPANSYCTGGTNKTACNTVAGKLYTKSAEGSGAATDCYVTLASRVYLAKPTDTTTTTCTAGYYCAGGDYHYSSTATNQGRSSCTGATYSGAGAASCSNCPSGYTANTSSNKTANTQCQISVTGGHYIAEAGQNSTNWGTCEAGYAKAAHTVNYGSTSSCAACTGATYAANTAQPSCTACPTATKYADKVKGYTYWITGGIQNSISGCRAIMKTTELQHGDLSSTSMQCYIKNGDYGDSYCQVTASDLTCDGGYYLNSTSSWPNWTGYDNAVANACTSVGTGYWSAEGDRARTACATGLTTCGSGKCANEADDCGRKLHAGDKVIHLRSEQRTTPSLRVKLGDTVFYGNLVSPVDGTLKVKNGTSTYSVANDNQ